MSDATQLTPRAMGVGLSQEDTHMKPQYDSQGRHIVDIAQECQCNERTVRRRLARYKKIVLAL